MLRPFYFDGIFMKIATWNINSLNVRRRKCKIGCNSTNPMCWCCRN